MGPDVHTVIAQDWYEFNAEGWNYIPDEFISYHLSIAALHAYAQHLKQCNDKYNFIVFEPNGDPRETEIDETLYDKLTQSPSGTVVI